LSASKSVKRVKVHHLLTIHVSSCSVTACSYSSKLTSKQLSVWISYIRESVRVLLGGFEGIIAWLGGDARVHSLIW